MMAGNGGVGWIMMVIGYPTLFYSSLPLPLPLPYSTVLYSALPSSTSILPPFYLYFTLPRLYLFSALHRCQLDTMIYGLVRM